MTKVPHVGLGLVNTCVVQPRFSVVISALNDESVISRSLSTVLAQTFAALEVVVVDAGSDDDTLAAVDALADGRVSVHRLTVAPDDLDLAPSLRYAAARAEGIRCAVGKWIALLDAADEVEPTWLARFGRLVDATGAAFVSCGGRQHFADNTSAIVEPVEVPGMPATIACLRPGAFCAPRSSFEQIDAVVHGDPVEVGLQLLALTHLSSETHVHTPELLVNWHEATDGSAAASDGDSLRLRWALQAIDALARTPIPDGVMLARYATIGGVAAARLRNRRLSRRLFAVARSAMPRTPENWARWAASLVPPAADRIWLPTTVS